MTASNGERKSRPQNNSSRVPRAHGPRLVEYLEAGGRLHELNATAKWRCKLSRWRRGQHPTIYRVDELCIALGLMLHDLPEHVWVGSKVSVPSPAQNRGLGADEPRERRKSGEGESLPAYLLNGASTPPRTRDGETGGPMNVGGVPFTVFLLEGRKR